MFPTCYLTRGQTNAEVMKSSFKRSHDALLHSAALTLQQAASAGDSWTLLGKSGSVSCGVTAPFPRVLVAHRVLPVPSKSLFPSPV